MADSPDTQVNAERQGKRNRKKKHKKETKSEEVTAQDYVKVHEMGELMDDFRTSSGSLIVEEKQMARKSKRKRKQKKRKSDNYEVDIELERIKDLSDEMHTFSKPMKIEDAKEKEEKPQREIVKLESEFRGVREPTAATAFDSKSRYVVHVNRPKDVEEGRENLPIVMMEQEIMEGIHENAAVIVCGETGCGKTTQVPQFLYEAGYGSGLNNERGGMIGVTQPRRVAVLGTARRVAHELNVQLGHEVGFQVRHDRKLGEESSIKFMTDGILLRELQGDFLLRKYSSIVLDEAHERSLNTDILIGMLSRIVPLRQKLYDQQSNARTKLKLEDGRQDTRDPNAVTPLKLVIMSATLRVEDFTVNSRMFPIPPPVIRVPARQFPVAVHFSKRTELLDYMGAAYKKVCAIHRKLPPGGILVFLTGQREVEELCEKLRKAFQRGRKDINKGSTYLSGSEDPLVQNQAMETDTFGGLNIDRISAAVDEEIPADRNETEADAGREELFDGLYESEYESDLGVSDDDDDVEEDVMEKLRRTLYPAQTNYENIAANTSSNKETESRAPKPFGLMEPSKEEEMDPKAANKKDSTKDPGPLHVLPLYAMLPAAAQLKVFGDMPKGKRFVVVATNVAETSITIPGVRYVVDCGRAKEKEFDRSSGISKFEVQWISKASADQRAGRAGRTGPGHCYRLYSSAHFNHSFPTFGIPEISKSSIEGVVLLMKCMGIDKVANFPFPTPPDRTAVIDAERCLKSLSALNAQTGMLTPMGQAMAIYPISPRHSRMLLAAVEEAQELRKKMEEADVSLALGFAIAVAAALSLDDPFLREAGITEEEEAQAQAFTNEREVHRNGFLATGTEPGDADVFHSNAEQQQDWMVAADKARMKIRRAKAGLAHSKFKNLSSDAISVANALRAYDQAQHADEFCQTHYLHSKTMSEMSKLRKQLWNLVVSNISDSKTKLGGDLLLRSEVCWHEVTEKKLDQRQEALIRQAICAGWADKVSRKLSLQERAAIPEAWHKRKVVGYRGCSLDEPVFLHPSSALCKEAPGFVVYNELVKTSRIYMQRVTAVEPMWLVRQAEALCTFSKPLSDPAPWYDHMADEVMCWVTPNFGPHLWELPLHKILLKKGKHRAAVFANALLLGRVLPSLSHLQSCLTNDPSIILKPESQALKRVSDLLYKLSSVGVDTRAKLRNYWIKDAHFLYPEIMSWVQTNHQMKVKDIWERLRQEAQLGCEDLFRQSN